jgi:hypothetical protein
MVDGSNGSEGGGNTITPPSPQKRISPAIRWCFTFNNFCESDLVPMFQTFRGVCKKVIIGDEIGESGTRHLQGYIEFISKRRPKSIGLSDKIHWEKAKGTAEQNREYCSKEKVIFTLGFPKPVKVLKESQLHSWEKEIIKLVSEEPDDRTIYWYWSSEGCKGKTTFCKYLTIKHGAICLAGKGADVRNGVCQYLEKNGKTPELVVFPIPRSYNTDYLNYESLENIKDMYFYSGKYEGGMVCGNCPHLFVFANEPPDTDKCSTDRWVIRNID